MVLDASIKRIAKPDRPGWLTSLQNDFALITNQDAKKHWGNPSARGAPYFNLRLEHIQQVEKDALRLLKEIPADQEIVLAAVWGHDRFPPQFDGDRHADRAAEWAQNNLGKLGFPAEKVEAVAFAIQHHIDPPGAIAGDVVEARLLWDANKLARMGSLNIIAYLCSHPAFPDQKITYTSLALLGLEKLEQSRRLSNTLYFDVSRKIAGERFLQQKTFYESLAKDVEA